MYPLNFFSLFPPFPKNNKVFVAMSFEDKFNKRWKEVIVPGISNIEIGGQRLEAYRVNIRKVSDSILTEILTGIGSCRLFFADLTLIGELNGRPIRNGNVMYEVGLANAVRLPEEVILFKSDDEPLLFDIANVRVNKYNPEDEPKLARQKIGEAIFETLKELDLKKHLAVQKAADSLDFNAWNTLTMATHQGTFGHPTTQTLGNAIGNMNTIRAISKLLELGILETQYYKLTPENVMLPDDKPVEELVKYKVTSFGKAVMYAVADKMNFSNKAVMRKLDEKFDKIIKK